jgi:hypothetical protein
VVAAGDGVDYFLGLSAVELYTATIRPLWAPLRCGPVPHVRDGTKPAGHGSRWAEGQVAAVLNWNIILLYYSEYNQHQDDIIFFPKH